MLPSDVIFDKLKKSSFRSRFKLSQQDKLYVNEKGIDIIALHARDFVKNRLAPAFIPNDGKQTPMRHHPVFVAQHATATCCRQCLYKWHHIPQNKPLSDEEQMYVVDTIMLWINLQMKL